MEKPFWGGRGGGGVKEGVRGLKGETIGGWGMRGEDSNSLGGGHCEQKRTHVTENVFIEDNDSKVTMTRHL